MPVKRTTRDTEDSSACSIDGRRQIGHGLCINQTDGCETISSFHCHEMKRLVPKMCGNHIVDQVFPHPQQQLVFDQPPRLGSWSSTDDSGR
jgi:hypothetical protein